MIARIRGVVLEISDRVVVVDVQGIGYELLCSGRSIQQLEQGKEASLITYMEVKEDLIRLHGFMDLLEKQVFMLLLKVSGIGARTASDILSQLECRDILRAIGASDITKLQSIKGIGKKTAERIVVELRDSVMQFAQTSSPLSEKIERTSNSVHEEDALFALVALGFSRGDAERAVREALKADNPSLNSSGELVKQALRFV